MTENALARHRCVIDPGYLAVSNEPALLCSVCGNGVIVTVWDPIKRNGGMAYCVFPRAGWGEKPTNYCADVALPRLLKEMSRGSSLVWNFQVQIFGGGNLNGYARNQSRDTLKTVKKVLRRHSITSVSEDVGGSIGRKVVFDTFSGDVMVLKTQRVRRSDWAAGYALKN